MRPGDYRESQLVLGLDPRNAKELSFLHTLAVRCNRAVEAETSSYAV
jgi:hypothetical protein